MNEHTRRPQPSRRGVHRRWVFAGTTALAVASTAAIAAAAHSESKGIANACTGRQRFVQVLVAPELSPVVEQAARRIASSASGVDADRCILVHVVPQQPAAVAGAITATPSRRPAAWIPDSSWWADRVASAGVALDAERTSVASSPVVLAVSPQLASRLGGSGSKSAFRTLLAGPVAGAVLALPDAERDTETALDLVQLVHAAGDRPTGRRGLARLLRGHTQAATAVPARVEAVASAANAAAPASEQAVLVQDHAPGGRRAVAVYPPSATSLDYPFLVLTTNTADQRVLQRLRESLRTPEAGARLASLGFRAARRPERVNSHRIDDALAVTNLISAGTRMLTVIDVSGSMGEAVPTEHGATRLDVTKAAASEGLSAFTDDTEIGLWIFSRHMSKNRDYRTLVPIGPLGTRGDGTLGRAQLAQALQQVHEVRDGGTALYATVLAAVRQVRHGWDRGRVNSVVLLTDGRDDGSGRLSLDGLLSTLHREAKPAQPVPVITVGLGGGSDTAALARISRATGGSSFVSRDGSDAFRILADAISRRACQPAC